MNAPVESIGTEATVKEAANKMAEQEIGSLIITHQDRPVGILTERDLLARENFDIIAGASQKTRRTGFASLKYAPCIGSIRDSSGLGYSIQNPLPLPRRRVVRNPEHVIAIGVDFPIVNFHIIIDADNLQTFEESVWRV